MNVKDHVFVVKNDARSMQVHGSKLVYNDDEENPLFALRFGASYTLSLEKEDLLKLVDELKTLEEL